jgi:CDP-diacylglycerol pyrophosphatase
MPEWIYILIFGTMVGALAYYMKKLNKANLSNVNIWKTTVYNQLGEFQKSMDKLSEAIVGLTKTGIEQREMFVIMKEQTLAEMKRLGEHALAADRQSAQNMESIADHEKRITAVETKCEIMHSGKRRV